MEINEQIARLLEEIDKKYKLEGQEIIGYLEGLLHQQYLDYWHYIDLDALLNLQHPRSVLKDEMIFIVYHQITELYFKLCLWEFEQIVNLKDLPENSWLIDRIRRINSYFYNLTKSFEIMEFGMEPEQFLKFRLSLLPASGFQSVQYRMIEIASTDLINLVAQSERENVSKGTIEEMYQFIYWKYGATELITGKKTLTLRRFEEKYSTKLIDWAYKHKERNLWQLYQSLPEEQKKDEALIAAYKELDQNVNVRWPLVHLKSAGNYLRRQTEHEATTATGGTNWQKYLPPKLQKRIFFPDLWTELEISTWGIRFSNQ